MDLRESKQDDIVIIAISGSVDAQNASHFDKSVQKSLDEGIRRFVIDFGGVELLTSMGLRVLVKLAKMVEGAGGLVLCSLNDHTRAVLDISGLSPFFQIAQSRQAALAALPEVTKISAVSALVAQAVGLDSSRASTKGVSPRSALTDAVDRALTNAPRDR